MAEQEKKRPSEKGEVFNEEILKGQLRILQHISQTIDKGILNLASCKEEAGVLANKETLQPFHKNIINTNVQVIYLLDRN